MRILVLSDLWLPFPGGAERLIFNLSREIKRAGHDVAVLTGYEYAQPFDGPEVEINLDMPLDARGSMHVAAVIDTFEPDVIVTHHVYARAFEPLLGSLPSQVPIVQIVLNGPRLPFADLAVYISEWVRARDPNARVEDLTITPWAEPDVVADSHGSAVGFIKPIPHKGVEFFYKIARLLPRREFVVLRGEWQGLESIEPRPNIRFMEPVADIREFWAEVNVVLVPSLSEDAGTVAQEATANGVPCISSDAGGLIETNGGGIILPLSKPKQWARMITWLRDPERYQRIVDNQRAYEAALDRPAQIRGFLDRLEIL